MYKLAAIVKSSHIEHLHEKDDDTAEESKESPRSHVPITVVKCDQTMLFKENMYCFGQYGGDIIYLQTLPPQRSKTLMIVAIPKSI